MQTQRTTRRALACGAAGLLAITGACLDPDWPQTVQSGPLYGDKGGATTVTTDAAAPIDSGEFEEGGDIEGGDDLLLAGDTCTINTTGVCQYIKAVNAASPPTCIGGTLGTSGVCATSGLVGCCTIANATTGNTIESCYYSGSAAGSTAATCSSMSGTFSAAQ